MPTTHSYTIIDADTHITEARDTFTSRVASKWVDRVPRVEWDAEAGEEAWFLEGKKIGSPGAMSVAGWREDYPSHPPRYEDAHPGAYLADARLKYMDELGIWAQMLYPNVGGFGSQVFLALDDPELKLACVRAYNDFVIEWCSADPRRLIAAMATPYWDVAASVKEIERCAKLGHRSVLFTGEPHAFGLPLLADRHWDPLWAAAQDAGLPVSFHIGSGDFEITAERVEKEGASATGARIGAVLFLANGGHLAALAFSGVLIRFPKLRFVSVESGVGWLPFLLQCVDYQFHALDVGKQRPEFELLPSEYLRRQVYGCFWFEKLVYPNMVDMVGVDRLMFETDFPHPTSIYGQDVQKAVEHSTAELTDEDRHRLIWENAAQLYSIEPPPA